MNPFVRRRRKPDINIVPLIDVLTILLFFFLMTMQYREVISLNLVLPKIETAGESELDRSLVIGIDAEGRFSIDGNRIEREELRDALDPLRPYRRDVAVLVMADEGTPVRDITYIMDQCRNAGLENIRLQSR